MILALFFVLLSATASFAAVTFDAGAGSTSSVSSSSTNHSHITGTGATVMTLGVTLAVSSGGAPGNINTLTYGGVNVLSSGELLATRTSNSSTIKQYVYCLDAPAVGTATAALTSANASGTNPSVSLSTMTFIGSGTCASIANISSASGSGTTFSTTVNGVASTSLVADVVCAGTDVAVGASQTDRASADSPDNACKSRGISTQLGSTEANATMSWTGTSDFWSIIAYEVPIPPTVVSGCMLYQNGTDKVLAQNGTDGFIFQGGGTCNLGGGGPTVVPVRTLMGVGL